MLVGVLGLILPALPGAPLVFLGALLAAWGEDFAYIGLGSLAAIGVLTVLAVIVDFAASAFGVRRYGASGRAMAGAAIGAVLGLPFGVAGVLLGPFLGAMIGELTLRRGLSTASRAGVGAALGLILGTAAKLSIAFAMLGIVVVMRLL